MEWFSIVKTRGPMENHLSKDDPSINRIEWCTRFVWPRFNRGQIERVRISSMQPVQLLNATSTARSTSVE